MSVILLLSSVITSRVSKICVDVAYFRKCLFRFIRINGTKDCIFALLEKQTGLISACLLACAKVDIAPCLKRVVASAAPWYSRYKLIIHTVVQKHAIETNARLSNKSNLILFSNYMQTYTERCHYHA